MTESNTFRASAATMLRKARRAMRSLVPYKDALTEIAERLDCSSPFQCMEEIDRLKRREAMLDKLEASNRDLQRTVEKLMKGQDQAADTMAKLEAELKSSNEYAASLDGELDTVVERKMAIEERARERWRLSGFADRKQPEDEDLLLWLFAELEEAEARLKLERQLFRGVKAAFCGETQKVSDAA